MFDQDTRRDYWLCQGAGWSLLLAIALLSTSSVDPDYVTRFAYAKTFSILTGLALSHGWHAVLKQRRWLDQPAGLPIGKIATSLLVLAVLQLGCVLAADLLFLGGRLVRDEATGIIEYTMLLILAFGTFSVWTLCYAIALTRRRAQRAEVEKLQLQVSVKDAELRALQFQINPHFFFNSLNSIRALVHQDPPAAATALSQLAGMMRQRLQAGQSDTITIGEEIASVSAYLAMEKLRFDERLQVAIDVDPVLIGTAVPPMVVQTLVENAIKHGVERRVAPCQVQVKVAMDEGNLVRITIRNQGKLSATSASTRLGLSNASRRLALLCGPQASCTLAEEDDWVCATVMIPKEKYESRHH